MCSKFGINFFHCHSLRHNFIIQDFDRIPEWNSLQDHETVLFIFQTDKSTSCGVSNTSDYHSVSDNNEKKNEYNDKNGEDEEDVGGPTAVTEDSGNFRKCLCIITITFY